MILFLAFLAFTLSAWLLFDLVAGARQSQETQEVRWQRAMSALSGDQKGTVPTRAPEQRPAPAVETRPAPYDLAA
jgi:hypothetical protein